MLSREQALVRYVLSQQAGRGRGGRGGHQRTGGEHLGGRGGGHAARQHQVHVLAGALEHLHIATAVNVLAMETGVDEDEQPRSFRYFFGLELFFSAFYYLFLFFFSINR